jgi:Sec-independent protein secretion pathway component TatC
LSEYKAAITLGIIALFLFSLGIGFATGWIQPLFAQIGKGMSDMVSGIFSGISSAGK